MCLATLVTGVAIERGAMLVGLGVVAGVLSIAALADGSIRRLRVRRNPRVGR